jgi:3',5'-cyclic AMP phosphodiesterase CpdA
MTRIAHITDLHFGATDPAVVAALADTLNADPPDLLAVSGDLTQGARRSEFRAAVAFLDSIAAPRLVVPGNHDITPYALAERFLDPYRRWRSEVDPQIQPVWHDGTVAVVGLNTARRAGLTLDWSRGRVTGHRLRRALAAFDALPANRVRIVVAHHPLLPPEQEPDGIVVGGARRALAAFAAHEVRLILSGHLHRSYSRLASPDADGPLVLQGGSATSTRLRGDSNAFNWITVEADGPVRIQGMTWRDGAWREGKARPGALPPSLPIGAPAGDRGPQTP